MNLYRVMRITRPIIAALFTSLCSGSLQAQRSIQVAPPKESAPLPVAFAGEKISGFGMDISEDGQYLLAHSLREAKVWKLPEGELIYRYQAGSSKGDKNGVYSQRFSYQPLVITHDGKYVFVSANGGPQALEAAELLTGELVPDGLLLDSLKAGKYKQAPALLRFAVKTDALPVPRDFNNGGREEPASVSGIAQDIQHPGRGACVLSAAILRQQRLD